MFSLLDTSFSFVIMNPLIPDHFFFVAFLMLFGTGVLERALDSSLFYLLPDFPIYPSCIKT